MTAKFSTQWEIVSSDDVLSDDVLSDDVSPDGSYWKDWECVASRLAELIADSGETPVPPSEAHSLLPHEELLPTSQEQKLPTIPIQREPQWVFPLDVPFSQSVPFSQLSQRGMSSRGTILGGLPSGPSPTEADAINFTIPSERGTL